MSKKKQELAVKAVVILGIIAAVVALFSIQEGEKPLPEENAGAEPRYALHLNIPGAGINLTTRSHGTITASARGRSQKIKMELGYKTSCKEDLYLPGRYLCTFKNIFCKMNGFHVTSDDALPERDWSNPFSHQNLPTDQREIMRRKLLRELKGMVANVQIELQPGSENVAASASGIDDSVIGAYPMLGKPLLAPLQDPSDVMRTFVASSEALLPDYPVGVGAVWYSDIPHPYLPGETLTTVVSLESIMAEGQSHIAHLKTQSLFVLKGKNRITTPDGEVVTADGCKIETTGDIKYNITEQREVSSHHLSKGHYKVVQGGASVNCRFNMNIDVNAN